LDLIHGLLMAAAVNVMAVLSSTEIGAPARKEGT
jgi:hypothetical protein